MGWGAIAPAKNVQTLLNHYYTNQLNQQAYKQLRHQLEQKVKSLQKKLNQKAETFKTRLAQSDEADTYRALGDLLMAHLHQWQPGMKSITLTDFTTGEDKQIPLNPEKNAVQNAQALYKQHQKLKRARNAVAPLLAEVQAEQQYLEQIETALSQIDDYRNPEDLQTLEEIREELIQENYLDGGRSKTRPDNATFGHYRSKREPNSYSFRPVNHYRNECQRPSAKRWRMVGSVSAVAPAARTR